MTEPGSAPPAGRPAPPEDAASVRLADALFRQGWRFFLPYLALYLAFRAGGWPTTLLRSLFELLHVALLLLLLRYAWARRSEIRAGDVAFWLSLAALFVLPGVYLEFPSDPWEHLNRIYLWTKAPSVGDHGFADRFAYFWDWSLVGRVPIPHRRLALSLLAGVYQMLIAFQFSRLARRLGASPGWAKAQVAGTLLLFGHYFSFYGYFALASTSLAYIAYLRALVVGLDAVERRRYRFADAAGALLLIWYNHAQELVLLATSGVGLVGHAAWRHPRVRALLGGPLPRLVAGGMLLAAAVLGALAGEAPVYPPPQMFSVLGIHGVIAVAAALLLWDRLGVVATLTLTPVLLLTFPPTAVAAHQVPMDDDLRWRLLFAFPTSFVLLEVLKLTVARVDARYGGPAGRTLTLALVVALFALALQPAPPYLGRLWFLLHRPPPDLSLEFVDQTAEWFQARRGAGSTAPARLSRVLFGTPDNIRRSPPPYQKEYPEGMCLVVGDNATVFALGAHLSSLFGSRRREPPDYTAVPDGLDDFLGRNPVCGFLLSNAGPEVASTDSVLAAISRHWEPDLVFRDLHADVGDLAQGLAERGWRSTPVPPFYTLWEPPEP